jgi:hypothetical protein
LAKTFFQQWEKMERIGNPAFAYSQFAEFDAGRFDWKLRLLEAGGALEESGNDFTGTETGAS